MAGSFSDYLENKLLDRLFGGVAYTFPTTLYFALYTAAPADSGGGTEVSGGGYARAVVAANQTNFPAAVGGAISNGVAITWPTAAAGWGTVVAIGIFDAASGGNLLAWATLAQSKTINAGDTFQIGPGDFDCSLD